MIVMVFRRRKVGRFPTFTVDVVIVVVAVVIVVVVIVVVVIVVVVVRTIPRRQVFALAGGRDGSGSGSDGRRTDGRIVFHRRRIIGSGRIADDDDAGGQRCVLYVGQRCILSDADDDTDGG